MENKKQLGSSSSAVDLLGAKKSSLPSSGAGVFASIFPPPPSVARRNYSCSDLMGCLQEQFTRDEVWSTRQLTAVNCTRKSERSKLRNITASFGNSHLPLHSFVEIIADKSESPKSCITNQEKKSIFLERVETSPLSSSLYYGGQEDMYICSSSTKSSSAYPFTKQGVEDDSHGSNSESACRGNWWQGSLYY